MNIERDVLEKLALEAADAERYYDLLDNLDSVDDGELMEIVDKARAE